MLRYVNAGHEAPWIGQGNGVRTQLSTTGPVVGLFEQAEFEVGSAEVRPGEWFFAYTDGATDAQNEAGEAFSEDLLRCTSSRVPPRTRPSWRPSARRSKASSARQTSSTTSP